MGLLDKALRDTSGPSGGNGLLPSIIDFSRIDAAKLPSLLRKEFSPARPVWAFLFKIGAGPAADAMRMNEIGISLASAIGKALGPAPQFFRAGNRLLVCFSPEFPSDPALLLAQLQNIIARVAPGTISVKELAPRAFNLGLDHAAVARAISKLLGEPRA
jgi:hypothetical protein